MALLWIDGFEGHGTTDDAIPAPTGILRRRYITYRDGSSSSYTKIKTGRFGFQSCLESLIDDPIPD